MSTQSERLRRAVWSVIGTIESRGLFVHSTDLTIRFKSSATNATKTVRVPLIVGSAVLNALVPRSAMLLIGGHGGGKTTLVKLLGRMMTGHSLREIEDGILRGHPQLTEEKMVATLKPGPLLKEGQEVVVWRRFVTGFWKIVDEVNRLTPHAQNILLSMLAEGELKYYDEVRRCEEYCLYATMNPADAGTFELATPFLDRFGIAVPITMPTINDLEIILASRDERLFGYDEFWQVPQMLSEEDLLIIWNMADKMPVAPSASEFMRSLIREFGACIRVDKNQVRNPNVETGLCDDCHFNTAKNICNKVMTPLSVRAAKDLNRYSKAIAWLLDTEEVTVEIVKSIAPLVFWHRVVYAREELQRAPFYGDHFQYTVSLVELAAQRFAHREPAITLLERFKEGEGSKKDLEQFEEMAKSDLLVNLDYIELAKELTRSAYASTVRRIEKSIRERDVQELLKIHDSLMVDSDFPNRSMLLKRVSEELHRLTHSSFSLQYETWQELWTVISLKFPKMTPLLKETLIAPKRRVIRTEGFTLVVYVTGDSPDSAVFLEISGGPAAQTLKRDIEKHLKQGGANN